jgi:hypothetical protein
MWWSAWSSVFIATLLFDTARASELEAHAPGELLLTEPALPAPRGELELQTTLGFSRDSPAAAWLAPFAMELEYGLTERVQVAMGAEWLLVHDAVEELRDGLGEVSLSVLYNTALASDAGFAWSWSAEMAYVRPASTEEDAATELELLAVTAKDYGAVRLHFNAGAQVASDELAWLVNTGALFGRGPLVPSIELSAVHGDADALSALPALHWAATDELEVTLGAVLRLSGATEDVMFLGAFRMEF